MGQVGLVTALLPMGRCLIDPVPLIVKLFRTCCSDFKTRKDLGKKPGMVEKSEQLLFFD